LLLKPRVPDEVLGGWVGRQRGGSKPGKGGAPSPHETVFHALCRPVGTVFEAQYAHGSCVQRT